MRRILVFDKVSDKGSQKWGFGTGSNYRTRVRILLGGPHISLTPRFSGVIARPWKCSNRFSGFSVARREIAPRSAKTAEPGYFTPSVEGLINTGLQPGEKVLWRGAELFQQLVARDKLLKQFCS